MPIRPVLKLPAHREQSVFAERRPDQLKPQRHVAARIRREETARAFPPDCRPESDRFIPGDAGR